MPTLCQTARCPEELTTQEWTPYFFNLVSVDPLYIVKTIPLLLLSAYKIQEIHLHFWTLWVEHVTSFKPIRDCNPPDHCDWLEMDTGHKAGQSASRRLMSQNFPLASGKRSLFCFSQEFWGYLSLTALEEQHIKARKHRKPMNGVHLDSSWSNCRAAELQVAPEGEISSGTNQSILIWFKPVFGLVLVLNTCNHNILTVTKIRSNDYNMRWPAL